MNHDPKTLSRVLAIQLHYAKFYGGSCNPQWALNVMECSDLSYDKKFLEFLSFAPLDKFDSVIADCIFVPWSLNKLDLLVKIILRIGSYEMFLFHLHKECLSEYVMLADYFLPQKEEVAFVNGVLQSIARKDARAA